MDIFLTNNLTNKKEQFVPKEKENIQTKEEESTPSPFSKSTNPHPDPKRK